MQRAEPVYTDRQPLGSAPLEADGSVKVTLPAGKPLILELVDKAGAPVFTMSEEHQLGPGETITPGVPRALFNGVCGGCHGSRSGSELDIAVTADAVPAPAAGGGPRAGAGPPDHGLAALGPGGPARRALDGDHVLQVEAAAADAGGRGERAQAPPGVRAGHPARRGRAVRRLVP